MGLEVTPEFPTAAMTAAVTRLPTAQRSRLPNKEGRYRCQRRPRRTSRVGRCGAKESMKAARQLHDGAFITLNV